MTLGNFLRCHDVTAKWEGGWSDHPSDPGGKTMYGITLAKFREHYPNGTAAQLRNISRKTALDIYQKDFWRPLACETLHAGVDLAVYDAGVNSGPARAKKWFAASAGGSAAQTVKAICAKRLGFVQSLKIWKTFGKGWSRRIADIEAKGVAWAVAATAAPPTVTKGRLETESEDAAKKAGKQAGGGAAAGGGGGYVAVEQADQFASWALLGFVALIVIVAGVLIWRAQINKTRAAAYAAEAAKL